MSNAYIKIEKLCLDMMYEDPDYVCEFTKDGKRFITDSYCAWIFSEKSNTIGQSFIKLTINNEKSMNKILNLFESCSQKELFPLSNGDVKIQTNRYTMCKCESFLTGDEAWLQEKYIKSFEPFEPTFWIQKDGEMKPVIVKSNGEVIGLIMPMHATDEYKVKRGQSTLISEDESGLEKCPFCGGDAVYLDRLDNSLGGCVICKECFAGTEVFFGENKKERAVKAWNMRQHDGRSS